jgi:hypothetical protein
LSALVAVAPVSLQVAVAAPFKREGVERLAENEVVVDLSLDRDWFTPDQARRLVDVAVGRGLLRRDGDDLVATFDRTTVDLPEAFTPDESLLAERSPFEVVLDAAVEAGTDKQAAVAAINALQSDLGVDVAAAAVVYARREGLPVDPAASLAAEDLGAPELFGAGPE